ncbi:MAG: hypothetical protein ACRDD7_08550 [Peptostreptococcaceae bacterium]
MIEDKTIISCKCSECIYIKRGNAANYCMVNNYEEPIRFDIEDDSFCVSYEKNH